MPEELDPDRLHQLINFADRMAAMLAELSKLELTPSKVDFLVAEYTAFRGDE